MRRELHLGILILTTCFLIQNYVRAQVPPITFHVETPGDLPNLISRSKVNEIVELTLTGQLNGTDLGHIRGAAQLKILNLKNANIVAGGESYYANYTTYTTIDNSISEYLFSEWKSIVSIILPVNITEIKYRAFYRCPNLTSVIIPEGVEMIEGRAFEYCEGLVSIVIPSTVSSIEYGAFSDCKSLTEIQIPKGITSIAPSLFYGCYNLEKVNIPGTVNSIGSYAFYDCKKLEEIVIPNTVKGFGSYAFWGCSGLTEISIPSGVSTIDSTTFAGCNGMKKFIVPDDHETYSTEEGVLFNKDKTSLIFYPNAKSIRYTIPSGVNTIGSNAFYKCIDLEEVILSDNITMIKPAAFSGCSGLAEIVLPDGLNIIGNYAFSGCKLAEVVVPENIRQIGIGAFSGCKELVRVVLPGTMITLTDELFSQCAKLSEITIPHGVETIGKHTFSGCSSLEKITLPSTVTSILTCAFAHCTALTEIHSNNPIPPKAEDEYTFLFVNKATCKIYVPENSFIPYWLADRWGEFKTIIEEDLSPLTSILANKISITSSADGIQIDTEGNTIVSVYNLSGQEIYHDRIESSAQIILSPGIYIVKTGDEAVKIVVK